MTDQPTNGGPRPRATKTRGQERADAIKPPSRTELAERIEQLERELARGASAATQSTATTGIARPPTSRTTSGAPMRSAPPWGSSATRC